MEALPTELRRELIKRVFPDLRYGGDPDIERYFEFRRGGRLGEALGLYNGPLRARYPDDQSRILLLRLYRENDPRWKELQDSLILKLAGRIAASIERNIDLLVEPIAAARLSNAFRALSAVESVLRVVPVAGSEAGSSRSEATRSDEVLAFLDRYVSLSRLLRYRAGEMEKARELVGEYLAMARADTPAEYDFIARSKAIEEKRREEERRKAASRPGAGREGGREAPSVDFIERSGRLEEAKRLAAKDKRRYFDLSRIEFSAVDRARIEIPANIQRREDKVLAFCWKYWELVADPGFGRLVFLYSKKYGTPHYAIFRTVQLGRMRRSTDDEILTAVSAILSTSYSYSVSGDLYMQAAWRRLKAGVEAEKAEIAGASRDREELIRSRVRAESEAASRRAVLHSPSAAEERAEALRKAAAAAEARPAPVARTTPETRSVDTTEVAGRRVLEPRDEERRTPQLSSEPGLRLTSRLERDTSRDEATIRSRAAAPAPTTPAPEPVTRAQRPASQGQPERRTSEPAPRAEAPRTETPKSALRPVEKSRKTPGLDTVRLRPPESAVERLSARTGSISDRIKKLSGKAYDVYQQIFFQGVRNDIHRCLVANRTHAFRLFDESANEAEDIIYAFMQEHYTDPFMNWEGSDERASVEALGFALPSLDPIIEAWFRRL
jgi:hypothetical protein